MNDWTPPLELEHRFPRPGRVRVGVEFTAAGDRDADALFIDVQPALGIEPAPTPPDPAPSPPGNQAPTATFTAPAEVPVNRPFALAATGSSDADGRIVRYAWDMEGDATPERESSSPITEYSYATAGTKTVTLTVVDDRGATAQAQRTIVVVGARGGAQATAAAARTFSAQADRPAAVADAEADRAGPGTARDEGVRHAARRPRRSRPRAATPDPLSLAGTLALRLRPPHRHRHPERQGAGHRFGAATAARLPARRDQRSGAGPALGHPDRARRDPVGRPPARLGALHRRRASPAGPRTFAARTTSAPANARAASTRAAAELTIRETRRSIGAIVRRIPLASP